MVYVGTSMGDGVTESWGHSAREILKVQIAFELLHGITRKGGDWVQGKTGSCAPFLWLRPLIQPALQCSNNCYRSLGAMRNTNKWNASCRDKAFQQRVYLNRQATYLLTLRSNKPNIKGGADEGQRPTGYGKYIGSGRRLGSIPL